MTLVNGCVDTSQYTLDAYWIDGLGTKHEYQATGVQGDGTCEQPVQPSWLGQMLNSIDAGGSLYQAELEENGNGSIYFKNGKRFEPERVGIQSEQAGFLIQEHQNRCNDAKHTSVKNPLLWNLSLTATSSREPARSAG